MEFTHEGVPVEELEYDDFCKFLANCGSRKKADFDKKIIKTKYEIFGLTSPQIHAIFKYLKGVNCAKILCYPSDRYYEITELQGLITVSLNKDSDEWFSRVENWIKFVDNWALCDTVMSKIPIKKGEKERIFDFATRLALTDDEFTSRCGIIIFLSEFLDGEHIERIYDVLKKPIYGKYYYVDMAVAWFAATALIKYRETTVNFLENSENITEFVYCKSYQKARESRRISQKDKDEFKEKIAKKRSKIN